VRSASRTVLRIASAALAAAILVGFALQLYLLLTGGADVNSGESGTAIPFGTRLVRLFSFFTVDSNVFVLVVAIARATGRELAPLGWRIVDLDALLSIAVTGTAFTLLLDPTIRLRDVAIVVNTLFHVVAPILFVAIWLLWGPRRRITWRVAVLAFVWPVVWLAYTFLHGAVTGWYPYPVLDAGRLGLGPALLGGLVVVAYAAVLAVVAWLIDRWAPALPGFRRPGTVRT